MNILFVCTGNTCRSPMAEKILRKKTEEFNIKEINIQSAGLSAIDGQAASKHAREVMRELGANDDHHSQPVTPELLAWADLILTMTLHQKSLLLDYFPELKNKLFNLKEYSLFDINELEKEKYDSSGLDIADPFGSTIDRYREAAKEIEDAINLILNKEILKKNKSFKKK